VGPVKLKDVMKELASVVGTGTDLGSQSYWYPEKAVQPTAFLVSLPDDYDPNASYGRGMAVLTLDGYVLADSTDAEGAVETLTSYVNGSGDNSIIEAVQKAQWSSCDSVVVKRIRFEPVTMYGVLFMAAHFIFGITGSGR
jgi:hypothetical protein